MQSLIKNDACMIASKRPPAAIRAMQTALGELRIEGIKTTVPLHREILRHAAFVEGRIDTTFVERSGLTQ